MSVDYSLKRNGNVNFNAKKNPMNLDLLGVFTPPELNISNNLAYAKNKKYQQTNYGL
jgi:hypothetical protein